MDNCARRMEGDTRRKESTDPEGTLRRYMQRHRTVRRKGEKGEMSALMVQYGCLPRFTPQLLYLPNQDLKPR